MFRVSCRASSIHLWTNFSQEHQELLTMNRRWKNSNVLLKVIINCLTWLAFFTFTCLLMCSIVWSITSSNTWSSSDDLLDDRKSHTVVSDWLKQSTWLRTCQSYHHHHFICSVKCKNTVEKKIREYWTRRTRLIRALTEAFTCIQFEQSYTVKT